MRKPDKYPTLDPRSPDIYRKIIDAADQLRRQRRLDQDFGLRLARQREAAARIAVMAIEAEEPVVIFVPALAPSGVTSGALQAESASVD